MKRNIKVLIIAALMAVAPLFLFAANDNPPPHPKDMAEGPPDDGDPNGPPVGAPIGNGTYILFALAAAYAGRKIYMQRSTEEETA